jgi:thiol-disulfide isomerase/thioredoxin
MDEDKTPKPLSTKTKILVTLFIAVFSFGMAFLLLPLFMAQETEPTPITSHLIEFYGKECPHCQKMAPIVAEVEKELNVSFSKLEVWHNSGNEKIFQTYSGKIEAICDGFGVPTFYNTHNGKALCGQASKQELIDFVNS